VPSIAVKSWLDPRVEVRPSPIHGLGLFALEAIDAGECVELLGGTLLTDAEVRERIARGARYDGVALDQDLNLSVEPRDWPGIHGNHSCDPNLWIRDAVTIEARRPIATGEELTIDYALHTLMSDWTMPCLCGSALCRRVVRGTDWRSEELRRRYAGHFTPSVARLIRS
jgi:uncharacterized protein